MRNKQVDTLYIVGNGFDIAHRYAPWNTSDAFFRTSYKDFRDFCKDNHPILYDVLSQSLDEEWNTFEDGLGLIPFDLLYEKSGFTRFDDFVYEFEEQLKDAFESWINQVTIKKGRCWRVKRRKSAFLTFNYTTTLESCYSIAGSDILHIHGVCSNPELLHQKPCIGHALTDGEIMAQASKVNIDYRGYYCDLLRWLQKDTMSNLNDYQNQLFFKKIQTVKKVYFYGFSFGRVDYPYIDYIVKTLPEDTVYLIGYYNGNDLANIKKYLEHQPSIKIRVQTVRSSRYLRCDYRVLSQINKLKLRLFKTRNR